MLSLDEEEVKEEVVENEEEVVEEEVEGEEPSASSMLREPSSEVFSEGKRSGNGGRWRERRFLRYFLCSNWGRAEMTM